MNIYVLLMAIDVFGVKPVIETMLTYGKVALPG